MQSVNYLPDWLLYKFVGLGSFTTSRLQIQVPFREEGKNDFRVQCKENVPPPLNIFKRISITSNFRKTLCLHLHLLTPVQKLPAHATIAIAIAARGGADWRSYDFYYLVSPPYTTRP